MSNQCDDEPFFIGWEAKPAAQISAFVKKVTLLMVVAGLAMAGMVTATQRTVGTGRFDFGNAQDFSGVLVNGPAPMLISASEVGGEKIFYLVAPLKRGFPADVAEEFHLRQVTLKGTFIGDDLDAMIEVVEGSLTPTGKVDTNPLGTTGDGEITVQGEIVDSKCHLGVMNPGRFKPHRACAIQCIKGGIPPILVAQTADGRLAHYLMVGPEGAPINDAVLDYVAEPVEVSGVFRTVGDRKVIYLDPGRIKRL